MILGSFTKVWSYDVFDTVLGRIYGLAEDIHLHIGEKVSLEYGDLSAIKFVEARRRAEAIGWQRVGYRSGVTIDEIYESVGELLGWNAARTLEALQIEIELESAAVRPLPHTLREISVHRASGKRLAFISDMHLREQSIRAMLMSHKIATAIDPVFVSSEQRVTKRSHGRLFNRAAELLSVSTWQIRHTGDDHRADFLMAWRQAVIATYCPLGLPNRWERIILERLKGAGWRERSVVSASKFSRLALPLARDNSPERWTLLCSVVSPFVIGFALWLIVQARKRGFRSLFFLARDMQIVCEVTQCLVAAMKIDLRCTYIYASRAALQPPAFSGDAEFDLFWLTDRLESPDPIEALRRILPEQDIVQLKYLGCLSQLPGEHVTTTVQRWMTQPRVRAAMDSAALAARGALISYLQQQGFTPDNTCALVDAGWRGTLQKCLHLAIQNDSKLSESKPSVHALYIGLRHQVDLHSDCTASAFLPSETVESLGYSLVSLIESFLTANHGTTLGYGSNDSATFEPKLATPPHGVVLRQWNEVRDACLKFVAEFIATPAIAGNLEALAISLSTPLVELCRRPDVRDAAAFRSWQFDTGRGSAFLKPLAPPLSRLDLLKLLRARFLRTPEADIYLAGPWLRGSIGASNWLSRLFANHLLS